MVDQHYGLHDIPRSEVLPGTAIKYRDRIYRASANVKKDYISTLLLKRL